MKKILVLFLLVVTLSGCYSGDKYSFTGSGENWDVFYTVSVSNGNEQVEEGTVKYTGSGDAPEMIGYKLESNSGGSAGEGLTITNGVGSISNGSCQGCAVVQKNERIEVEITWDGQIENLILTTDK